MKKLTKITIGTLLFVTSSAILAAPTSCPPASALIHTPGKSWQLSAPYSKNGWALSADVATIKSNLTTLNTNNQSLAYLSARPNTSTFVCYYNVAKNSNIILSASNKELSKTTLKNIIETNKNFMYGYGNNGQDQSYIVCSAHNGTINNLCKWI